MIGARNPAAFATFVKRAWNGRPDGFPRGSAATFREPIPRFSVCARAAIPARGNDKACLRVIGFSITPGGANIGDGTSYGTQMGQAAMPALRFHRRVVSAAGRRAGRPFAAHDFGKF